LPGRRPLPTARGRGAPARRLWRTPSGSLAARGAGTVGRPLAGPAIVSSGRGGRWAGFARVRRTSTGRALVGEGAPGRDDLRRRLRPGGAGALRAPGADTDASGRR